MNRYSVDISLYFDPSVILGWDRTQYCWYSGMGVRAVVLSNESETDIFKFNSFFSTSVIKMSYIFIFVVYSVYTCT